MRWELRTFIVSIICEWFTTLFKSTKSRSSHRRRSLRKGVQAYQGGRGGGVKNVSFSENFSHVLNEWPLALYQISVQRRIQDPVKDLWSFHCLKTWNVQIQIFFWSVFSCVRTEYEDLRSKSPYPVRIQENTDQKKIRIWTLSTQCKLELKTKESLKTTQS